ADLTASMIMFAHVTSVLSSASPISVMIILARTTTTTIDVAKARNTPYHLSMIGKDVFNWSRIAFTPDTAKFMIALKTSFNQSFILSPMIDPTTKYCEYIRFPPYFETKLFLSVIPYIAFLAG